MNLHLYLFELDTYENVLVIMTLLTIHELYILLLYYL